MQVTRLGERSPVSWACETCPRPFPWRARTRRWGLARGSAPWTRRCPALPALDPPVTSLPSLLNPQCAKLYLMALLALGKFTIS